MTETELLEGVVSKSKSELAAYILTVAEAYAAAPSHDPSADRYWVALNLSNTSILLKRLMGTSINLVKSAQDPYSALTSDPDMMIRYMLYDMVVNKRLAIYTGDTAHPIFSSEENIAFRAVHDFFAHGKIRASFFEQLKDACKKLKITKLPPLEQAGELLAMVKLNTRGNRGSQFNGRGEMNAAAAHMRLAPKAATPAIFTEVVGQVAYQLVTGKFGVQKIAVLDGFDFNNLGACIAGSKAEIRMNEILTQINSDDPYISSSFGELNASTLLRNIEHGV